MGVSVAATWYTRLSQADWNQVGGHINPFNPVLYQWLSTQGLDLHSPLAPASLTQELGRQASMLAFIQVYQFIALSFLLMTPLLMLLKSDQAGAA
jgi:DHA2 family multidrug resistance protein